MPVITRQEADAQGMTDEDMVSLENPPNDVNAPTDTAATKPAELDDATSYIPVFCLSDDIPSEYFTHLKSHTQPESTWLEITTSDPYAESILTHTKAHAGLSTHAYRSPAPFRTWQPKALYDFHTQNLRPLLTLNGNSSSFTYFTFLAIDAACFQAGDRADWEIIVYSDAPDFNESVVTGPKLKVFRAKISEVMGSLAALEMMTRTPLEEGRKCPMGMALSPPAYLAGPPRVGREYKWRAIAGLPEPEGPGVVQIFDV